MLQKLAASDIAQQQERPGNANRHLVKLQQKTLTFSIYKSTFCQYPDKVPIHREEKRHNVFRQVFRQLFCNALIPINTKKSGQQ